MSQKKYKTKLDENKNQKEMSKKISTSSLGLPETKSEKLDDINTENEIKIPIIDDSDLADPLPISDFLEEAKKQLKNNKINLEEYVSINDVDDQLIMAYLNELINNNDFTKFYNKYEFLQYRLKLSDRFRLQKLIKDRNDIPKIIKLNWLTSKTTSIKLLFIEICSNIIRINRISYAQITKVFSDKNVFFEQPIDIRVPNKYGTNEIQFYSLLSDIFFYFEKFKGDKINLKEKFQKFYMLKYFIDKMNFLDEKELISNTNLLINMLYIFKEKGDIDNHLFSLIVKSCTPFNTEIANESLNFLQNNNELDLYINNISFKSYKKKIKENDIITFKISKNSKIQIEAKYFNWDIKENICTTLNSEYFMLSIKYPENTKYNFYILDNTIKKNVVELFEKMIKSPSIKQAMLFDEELAEYKYLFTNDNIIKECEKNVHLVYFPFDNYNGYTDKKSFDVYINISMKNKNTIEKIITDFKLFFVSKCHEFKHVTRIYMKVYNNSNISTPILKLNDYKDGKEYLLKIHENSVNNIIKSSINYNKNSKNFNNSMKEYGDFFENALFGYKMDPVFFYSAILFLRKDTWDWSPQKFYNEYDKTMKDTGPKSINALCNKDLPKLIYSYFSSKKKSIYYSNNLITKNSSIVMSNENILISVPRASHRPKFIKPDDDMENYYGIENENMEDDEDDDMENENMEDHDDMENENVEDDDVKIENMEEDIRDNGKDHDMKDD